MNQTTSYHLVFLGGIVFTIYLTYYSINTLGKVVTMGHNNDAQLGRGHARSYTRSSPQIVKIMIDKEVTLIATGSTFTVVGNYDISIYFDKICIFFC